MSRLHEVNGAHDAEFTRSRSSCLYDSTISAQETSCTRLDKWLRPILVKLVTKRMAVSARMGFRNSGFANTQEIGERRPEYVAVGLHPLLQQVGSAVPGPNVLWALHTTSILIGDLMSRCVSSHVAIGGPEVSYWRARLHLGRFLNANAVGCL